MSDTEREDLKARIQALENELKGVNASFRPVQVNLDAALQKHKDDAKAHEDHLASLTTAHAKEIESLNAGHKTNMESQAGRLADEKAKEIAALKETVLIPALRELYARQQADTAAQHEAKMRALLN